jgi:hypothetical protein
MCEVCEVVVFASTSCVSENPTKHEYRVHRLVTSIGHILLHTRPSGTISSRSPLGFSCDSVHIPHVFFVIFMRIILTHETSLGRH